MHSDGGQNTAINDTDTAVHSCRAVPLYHTAAVIWDWQKSCRDRYSQKVNVEIKTVLMEIIVSYCIPSHVGEKYFIMYYGKLLFPFACQLLLVRYM